MENIKKIIKIYFKYVLSFKWVYFTAVLMSTGTAILNVIYPIVFGNFVESFSLGTNSLLLFALPLGIFFFEKVVFSSRNFFADRFTNRIIWNKTHLDFMNKVLNVDYSYHMNKSSGELISVSKRMEDAFYELFWGINLWVFTIFLEFSLSIYYLFTVDWLLGVLMIVTIVLSLVLSVPLVKKNLRLRKTTNDADDEVHAVLVDNLTGFETVKLFAKEQSEQTRMEEKLNIWEKLQNKADFTYRQIDLLVYSILFVGSFAMTYIAYTKVDAGIWGVGILITVFSYISSLNWKSFELLYKYRRLLKISVDIQKYLDLMELESKVVEIENPILLNSVEGNIKIENLSFGYDDNDKDGRKVLYDINLEIQPDETVALVGRSGSGKTTLTKLLLRFYDPDVGRIFLDGHDLKTLKLEDLRRAIGVVPQSPIMFNESIKYNVAYGKQDATIEEIKDAVKKASLDKFVDSLPNGYDTIVGERGIKLSGGQRQRLAIARIILSNPEIVIFDEATSQLDSENERNIQEAFENLSEKRTTLIIAHRLSTVMNADRIVVFDDGEIKEIGSHDELMKLNGIYASLWKLQTEVLK
jgi:ATP-binding cassette subfamily B protein